MRERDRVGRERYGQSLRPFNGRDALRDATEEALDLLQYLKQVEVEWAADRAELARLRAGAAAAAERERIAAIFQGWADRAQARGDGVGAFGWDDLASWLLEGANPEARP